MATSIAEQLAAAARDAVARLFTRTKLRMGVIQPAKGDKRLYVTVRPEYTLPGLYEQASREHGYVARRASMAEVRRAAAGFLDGQQQAVQTAVGRVVHHLARRAEGVLTKDVRRDLQASLEGLLTKVVAAVERIADSEATAARNLAGLDAAAAMGKSTGDEDPTVYWVITRTTTCPECYRVHCLPDKLTPRVWKLSEVSSAYHQRGDDKPSLFGLHPHCFVGDTRLHTDRGLLTVKELFDQSGELIVAVDARVKNKKVQCGRTPGPWPEILGDTWLDRHEQGVRFREATHVYNTGVLPCLKIELDDGRSLTVSEEHTMWVDDDNMGKRVKACELKIGDKLPLLSGEAAFGKDHFPGLAELMGNLMGDGHIGKMTAQWRFFGADIKYGEKLLGLAKSFSGPRSVFQDTLIVHPPNDKYQVEQAGFCSAVLARVFKEEFSLSKRPRRVPARLWGADKETVASFLRGLYAADGHSEGMPSVVLSQNDREFLGEIQLLLANFGLRTRVFTACDEHNCEIRYADGSVFQTHRKAAWRLCLGGWEQVQIFAKEIGMGVPKKQERLVERLKAAEGRVLHGAWRTTRVISVEAVGEKQTYCLTEPHSNTVTANGLVVGQCQCSSATLARGYGFDAGGNVTFVSLDHDEFKKQRGL